MNLKSTFSDTRGRSTQIFKGGVNGLINSLPWSSGGVCECDFLTIEINDDQTSDKDERKGEVEIGEAVGRRGLWLLGKQGSSVLVDGV